MKSYDFDINIIDSLESEINDLVSQKHAKLSFIDNLESKIKLMNEIKSKNKHLYNQQENLEILGDFIQLILLSYQPKQRDCCSPRTIRDIGGTYRGHTRTYADASEQQTTDKRST